MIQIELSRQELEILLQALRTMTPTDKSHEMILIMLYARFQRKLEDDSRE